MRGLLQIGRSLALRRLPRLGAAGGSRGVVSVPGFSGRPAGYGPGGSVARGVSARCLGTSLSWRYLTALVGRRIAVPARGDTESLRPACRVQRRGPSRRLPKAPGAALSRTAWGRVQAPLVGVQPTPVPSAPSRGAGKAAASSRIALPLRRASVVSTVSASERVETTPRKDAGRNRNRFNKGGLWIFNATRTALRGSYTRKSCPGIAEGQLFSPESQGHQAVGSGRVIPHEPLAG